jgi:acyl carrier protein
VTEQEIRAALRAWICRASRRIAPEQLTDETPIVEQRIVSSLQVMELLLHVEALRGAPIDLQALRPGALRDVDTIYRTFFEGVAHAA